MVWICFISLLLILIINYNLTRNDIFSPNLVFVFTFTCAVGLCCIANLIMGIDFESYLTYVVIITGAIIFTFVKWLRLFPVMSEQSNLKVESVEINDLWYVVSLGIVILGSYFNYQYILQFGQAYGAGDFLESMVLFKMMTTLHATDDMLVTPVWYRNVFIVFSCVVSYISLYIVIRTKVLENKLMLIPLGVVIIYFFQTLMSGGRSESFRIVTAALFLWYVFFKSKYGARYGNQKAIKYIFFILGLMGMFFFSFVVLIGRSARELDWQDLFENVFVYAGAPILNLDYYLTNPWRQTWGIWGELTFKNLINYIGKKFSISNYNYELDLPFLSFQNFDMGNVYTTYYAFYYDFQILGVIILTLIMALICTYIYSLVQRQNIARSKINVCVLSYSYLVNDIVMSMFSHRVYETIVDIGTYHKLIILLIMVHMIDINIRKKKAKL